MGKAQLIYLMDPHCGWCFGYSGIIQDIVAHYKDDDRLDLALVTGGLFHPALATSLEFAEDKRPIAARISQVFGVTFADEYFTNVIGSGRLDSLVPSKAINAIKIKADQIKADQIKASGAEFDFAARLINAAFKKGRNISNLEVCLMVAEESGFDPTEIGALMSSAEVQNLTDMSFDFAKQSGTGFPSLFLRQDDKLTHLGGTQLDKDALVAHIDDILRLG